MSGPSGETERRGWPFWAAAVAGWGLVAVGLLSLFGNTKESRPSDLARWFTGSAVLHDGLVAPLVCAVGLGLARIVPRPARGPVVSGLVITATTALFAWPFLRQYGDRPDNPSALPLNYATGLAWVLAVVWLVCGALAVTRWWRARPT